MITEALVILFIRQGHSETDGGHQRATGKLLVGGVSLRSTVLTKTRRVAGEKAQQARKVQVKNPNRYD